MPALQPADPSFAAVATHHVDVAAVIEAPLTKVWEILADHGSWDTWYPGMSRCQTTEPGGLGATRTVKIGPLVADERWVIWEPERTLGFTVTRTNLPMAKQILEQVELEPVRGGSGERTRIRFIGSYRPNALTRRSFGRTTQRIDAAWRVGFETLAQRVQSMPAR